MSLQPRDDATHLSPVSNLHLASFEPDAETPIQEEVAMQQTVPCLDQEVLLILTPTGTCYVDLMHSCTVLGLNTRGQLQRISAHSPAPHGSAPIFCPDPWWEPASELPPGRIHS